MSGPLTAIPASLGADCTATRATYGSWNVRSAVTGPSDIFIFDGPPTAVNTFYDTERYGTYYVEPRNSWNTFYDLAQNTGSYVVKSGSTVAMRTARSGRYLTVRVAATYYSPAAGKFVPWQNKRVVIQYKDKACPGCAWKGRGGMVTDSSGVATFYFSSPYLAYYRAFTVDTSSIWGRSTATLFR